MNLKRTAAVALSTAALVLGGAGVSHADGPKFQNNTQILSCLSLEVLDIPILSSANNNIDCSKNYKHEAKFEKHEYRDYDRKHDRDRDRDYDRKHDEDRDKGHDRDYDKDHDRGHDKDYDKGHDRY